uniref:C-CAP/cofactor C-like domain-containing protein n=1 Tax=Spongospora subterranea TaxID=70186 RepID=A0A0H5R4T9_9EUKA|eukprot:CRZ08807.1 hypothetical protein [Spongospora subterranea]
MKAKNRPAEERSGLVVVPAKKANVVSSAGPAKNVAKKPPSISHNQGKWLIENFVGVDKVEIPEDVQVKHTVYIYKCENCIIVLPMKVKAICMDSCKKAGLLFGSVEIVNCHSVEVGMTGSAPSIAVDKTHGCQLILSNECLDRDPSIVMSNISEVNIRTPGENDHCDPIEMPIPEQFITKISGKPGRYKLSTQHVTHG